MSELGAAEAGKGSRPRCHDVAALTLLMTESFNTPIQFECSGDVKTDKILWKTLLKANADFFKRLYTLQPNLCYSQLVLKTCMQEVGQEKADEWGFVVPRDSNKWASDTSATLFELLKKVAKQLRQPRPACWLLDTLGIDKSAGSAGAEGGGFTEWYVGWCPDTQSAWRAPGDDENNKQYTKDIRPPHSGGDFDPCVAWWGDGYCHEVAAITGAWLREQQARDPTALGGKVSAGRWSMSTQKENTVCKIGTRTQHQQKFFVLLLANDEVKECQVCQIETALCGDDADEFTRKLAEDYAKGRIDGVTWEVTAPGVNKDRAILRAERDGRLSKVHANGNMPVSRKRPAAASQAALPAKASQKKKIKMKDATKVATGEQEDGDVDDGPDLRKSKPRSWSLRREKGLRRKRRQRRKRATDEVEEPLSKGAGKTNNKKHVTDAACHAARRASGSTTTMACQANDRGQQISDDDDDDLPGESFASMMSRLF